MRITGFVKNSLIDWDGYVCSVAFLPGCNFRCPFCQNPELALNKDTLSEVPLPRIREYLEEHSDFLDGVVITGGEPTIHEDLPDLIREFKDMGLMVKLDTNGSRPALVEDLIGADLLDFVSMDIKAPLDSRYNEASGTEVDLDKVKQSISSLMEDPVDYEFRTTVVPVLLDKGDIEDIAAYIGGARRYILQQFRPKVTLDDNYSVLDPYSESELREMAEIAKEYVRKVLIRGEM